MKKYDKPILNIDELSSLNYIANNTSTFAGSLGVQNAAGDKGIDFSEFGLGDWN